MAQSTKSELRSQFLALRPGSSAGLSEQLIALATKLGSKNIGSYVPLNSEPDVTGFNQWVSANGNLYLPRIQGENLVFATGDLARGELGLMQPTGGEIDPLEIQLVAVPALGADRTGNRLGKGRGFYDRFLPLTNAVKVAVVFDSELVAELPFESHDQRVDYVVTPNRTIAIGR